MSLPALTLRVLLNEGRFIRSVAAPNAPLNIPAFSYGDVLPIKIETYQRDAGNSSLLRSITPPLTVSLFLGHPNQRPNTGFYTISNINAVFPALAEAYEVEAETGDYTAVGDPGDIILTAKANGAQAAPTATYTGNVSVTTQVTTISAGDANNPACWRIELLSAAPAKCDTWAAGSTTPASTLTNPATKLFWFTPDANAQAGFFKFTCGGFATNFISLFATIKEIEYALQASGVPGQGAAVQNHPAGGFLIALQDGATTLTVDDSTLVIPANITGTLDLTGAGVRDMLQGGDFVSAFLTCRITDAGNNVVSESVAPVVIAMPSLRAS